MEASSFGLGILLLRCDISSWKALNVELNLNPPGSALSASVFGERMEKLPAFFSYLADKSGVCWNLSIAPSRFKSSPTPLKTFWNYYNFLAAFSAVFSEISEMVSLELVGGLLISRSHSSSIY